MRPWSSNIFQALASNGSADISTNDAVAALVWTLMCHLRKRPLPGYAPPGCTHCMGLAVDLRRNGLSGILPINLFANATWCLHVPILPDGTRSETPATAKREDCEVSRWGSEVEVLPEGTGTNPSKNIQNAEFESAHAIAAVPVPHPSTLPIQSKSESLHHVCCSSPREASGNRPRFLQALRHGARQVRDSLTDLRSKAPSSGWCILDHAATLKSGPLSAQVNMVCNVIGGQDAILSSWQFPYWSADFGNGGPLRFGEHFKDDGGNRG
ncbi:hypothetical protein CEUSTIGMA_g79.t1 [Chlamydomonas eustigma]|uniref:Uncharacterized protein n=1 Tax=Chlamydomonas eustigma TaxID=1157962 RepID=A0A250WP75_9CHLO|nr:hypothetical protein CEUSTIGMA_g79.t1 [Chlamydomonas eustigma]|eukprot:GAX72623.1 hypothetical protein CEUSTIGMA_g79.t1 [Chlamydomonas eustigma]